MRRSPYPSLRRIAFLAAIGACLGALAPGRCRAGGDEVVVVYNNRLAESKSVAEHYAQRRGVPTSQVCGLPLHAGAEMTRARYHEDLLRPLTRRLQSAGLLRFSEVSLPGTNGQPPRTERRVVESRIRYAVLCYGVPWRITPDRSLAEAEAEKMRPELRRNEAAVDTELACLPLSERPYLLSGPLPNPFYQTTNPAALHPTNGVLLVSRLDGPTADVARGLVDKALQAEADGLWGRAYVDLRGRVDAPMQHGEDLMRNTAELCRFLGFETVADTNGGVFPASFPMSQIAFYAGWYSEHVAGPFAQPSVEFMPGAFAYHLHSFSGANLHSVTQHWVGPFLAKGATITMGSVDEPYLGGTPDVAVFAARLTFQGFTFGEAAYAAQNVLSWQTTIVGDPLYRPFGKSPQQLHEDLERRGRKLLEWSHLRVANLNLARGAPVAEVAGHLESLALTRQSAVLMEKLGDLHAAQGKPSSSVHACQQALKLSPSPQQRVRLSLGLAERLTVLEREAEAYAVYQQFLTDSADYPDMPAIYRKLVALAQKLRKPDDVKKYTDELNRLSPSAANGGTRRGSVGDSTSSFGHASKS